MARRNATPLSGPPAIIPRAMLVGVGAVLALAILAAGALRLSGLNVVALPPSRAVASRDLRFEDRSDRGVDVRDAVTGLLVETIPPKTGGFLRGVMRGLLYDYRYGIHRSGEAADHSFRLTQWADGRLSLDDTASHQRIELEAFGSTNRDVFARFLEEPGHT